MSANFNLEHGRGTNQVSTGILTPSKLHSEELSDVVTVGEYQRMPVSTSVVPAVRIRNAYKAYTHGKPIIDNMDMTVPRGSIYGLLGSSGCGKTTILSCIVGLRDLNSGEILVFGCKPGTKGSGIPGKRLGYMPQDIALYRHLTISETLQYFGRIFGMSASEINEQINVLVGFLQLPDKEKIVGTLSGGQQRRTSLAACLIHDPDLLILGSVPVIRSFNQPPPLLIFLDEPTVGLDPVLRESIWNHLYQLVATRRTTVILTTHYIEEARHSHTVGLMRNGRLLSEKEPGLLLKEHNAHLLEDIVLKLCKNDLPTPTKENGDKKGNKIGISSNQDNPLLELSFYSRTSKMLPLRGRIQRETDTMSDINANGVVGLKFSQTVPIGEYETLGSSHLTRKQSFVQTLSEDVWARTSRIKALIVRNFLIFFRNPLFVIGVLVVPSFQIAITSLIVGKDIRHITLGVVNHESLNWMEICDEDYKQEPACGVNLTCKYLNQLRYHNKDYFNLVPLDSELKGLEQVSLGQMWGYMSFPENYTTEVSLRAAHALYADDEAINGSTVKVRLDMSQYLTGAFTIINLFDSFQEYTKISAEACGADPREADLPFEFTSVFGSAESSFTEYIIPGVLVMIVYLFSFCSCAFSIISDRKQGTMGRSFVAGIKSMDIMISYFVTEGCIVLLQVALGATLLIFAFELDVKGSIYLFIFICILSGLCGQATGMILGCVCKDEEEVLFAGLFIYLPMMCLAGVVWPLEAMPTSLRYFSYTHPLTLACESVRSITSRGVDLLHIKVWPGVVVVILWTIVLWFLALRMLRSLKKQ